MSSTWIDLLNLNKPLKYNEFAVHFDTNLYNAKTLPDDIQKKLDERWNELVNDAKPGRILYNQSKFRLHSVELKENNVILNLGLTDYKSFICTQQQSIPNDIRQYITE